MFDSPDYIKPLDEELFEFWLENGRESKIGYNYLLIIWDALDVNYKPVYAEERDKLTTYDNYGESSGHESLVAAYDLYSESRIALNDR